MTNAEIRAERLNLAINTLQNIFFKLAKAGNISLDEITLEALKIIWNHFSMQQLLAVGIEYEAGNCITAQNLVSVKFVQQILLDSDEVRKTFFVPLECYLIALAQAKQDLQQQTAPV